MFVVDNVFKLQYWKTSTNYAVYVFRGDLSTFVYSDPKADDIIYVDEFIFLSDTIDTIKYKIVMNCGITSQSFYMWGETMMSQEYLKVFSSNLFVDNIKLDTTYINRITKLFCGKSFFPNNEKITRLEFEEGFKTKTILCSYDFTYMDTKDHDLLFSPNPFTDQDISFDSYAKVSHENQILSRMQPVDNTINFVSSESSGISTIYISPTDKKQFANKNSKSILQKEFIKNNVSDVLDTLTTNIEYLYFRVIPYSHDIELDMNVLFLISEPSINVPIIAYKSKYANQYKVHKYGLSQIEKRQIDMFKHQELKYMEKMSTVHRSNESIIYYIKFSENILFYLLVSENGSYKLKFKFNKSHSIQMVDIVKNSYDKVQEILTKIDDNRMYIINKETNIFRSKFIDIIDYNTKTVITLKKPLLSHEIRSKNFKGYNPFFSVGDVNKNMVKLEYIDTNNFYNTDSVTAFIYKHMELNKNELIAKLQEVFSINENEAQDIYEEKKNNINLKITKKGTNIFAVREYHTGVNVQVALISDYAVKVRTTNTQDDLYIEYILFYLLNLLLFESSQKKELKVISNEKNPTNDDNGDVYFHDLLDDFDFDEIDDLNIDVSSPPKVNIETDIQELSNDEDEDEDKPSENVVVTKKTDYTTFVLDKLYQADPKLFLWKDVSTNLKNYPSKCQAVDFRQPIVVTKQELENIDKNHPGSYTGFVKTGSTEQLKELNYYICPKIWCHVGRVSITMEEYEKYDKKCPSGEEPLFFPKLGSKKNYFLNKNGVESHWPALLKKNQHPKGFELPCCGKKPLKDNVSTNKQSSNYIANISTDLILGEGKYGNLPLVMNILLNKKSNCVGIVDAKTTCFARTGVGENFNSLMKVLEVILNKKNVSKHITDNLDITQYIFLNHGYTMKTFVRSNDVYDICDKNKYEDFKLFFANNKDYITKFNLQKEANHLKKTIKFEISEDILIMSIMREYLIYRSYINFKNYITQDTIEKDLSHLYHLLTFKSINKEDVNFIFIEIGKDGVSFMNPKYFRLMYDETRDSVIILKIGDSFEYVSMVSQKKQSRKKELFFKKDQISDLMKHVVLDVQSVNPKISKVLLNEEIDKYVFSTNMKCIGVFINNNFVPFNEYVSIHYDDMRSNSSVIYIDKLDAEENNNLEILQSSVNKWNLELFSQPLYMNRSVYNDELYTVAKTFQVNMKLKSALCVLNHEISNFSKNEKKELLMKMLNKSKIEISAENIHRILHDILHIPLEYIINQHKLRNHGSNNETILLSYEDLNSNKLQDIFYKYSNKFQVVDTSFDDFVDEVEFIKIEQSDDTVKLCVDNKFEDIKPMKLKNVIANTHVIEEYVSYSKLHDIIYLIDNKLVNFQKFLDEQIIALYQQNKTELIQKYKQNISFTENDKMTVNNLVGLVEKEDYHYSVFELQILSKYVNCNILIIGRVTSLIPNGIQLIKPEKPTPKYIVFNYHIGKSHHVFKLVVEKSTCRFLFLQEEFEKEIIKYLK